jgi:hypothetical protein
MREILVQNFDIHIVLKLVHFLHIVEREHVLH